MIKVLWHYSNDNPRRKILFSNLTDKDFTIRLTPLDDLPTEEPPMALVIASKKRIDYHLDYDCAMNITVDDIWGRVFVFDEKDLQVTITIADREDAIKS